jgi:hypothetical protein
MSTGARPAQRSCEGHLGPAGPGIAISLLLAGGVKGADRHHRIALPFTLVIVLMAMPCGAACARTGTTNKGAIRAAWRMKNLDQPPVARHPNQRQRAKLLFVFAAIRHPELAQRQFRA